MGKLMQKIAGTNWKDWLNLHHAIDWAIVFAVLIAGGLMAFLIPPHERYIPEDTVSYPQTKDIIPVWALMIITLALPLVVFGATQIWHHSRHDFHHATLGTLMAWAFTNFIVTCIKLATGRPRPNYTSTDGTLGTNDSRSSFPSGHSALSFSSLVFVSLYLAAKMKIFKNHEGSLVAKASLVLLPIALATVVSVSRVIDYHHDFSDVQAGALIGAGIGLMAYFLWYPSQFDEHCDLPRIHPIVRRADLESSGRIANDQEEKEFKEFSESGYTRSPPPRAVPIVVAA